MSMYTPDKVNRKSNGHPRPILDAWETTEAERLALDYVDWKACERGEDSFQGFRYRGELYDLSEFEWTNRSPLAAGYDAWRPESAFSAVAVVIDHHIDDQVVVTYLHW